MSGWHVEKACFVDQQLNPPSEVDGLRVIRTPTGGISIFQILTPQSPKSLYSYLPAVECLVSHKDYIAVVTHSLVETKLMGASSTIAVWDVPTLITGIPVSALIDSLVITYFYNLSPEELEWMYDTEGDLGFFMFMWACIGLEAGYTEIFHEYCKLLRRNAGRPFSAIMTLIKRDVTPDRSS